MSDKHPPQQPLQSTEWANLTSHFAKSTQLLQEAQKFLKIVKPLLDEGKDEEALAALRAFVQAHSA